ncbi:unnamed protein product [Bursaphelenchus okinawaensis]|uniref:Fatty-acid and retinol-binding protein 1 n=1 Tax=Bursaphelenchus okinawaensis TaxID=465554 RepID=A0A811K2A8_9BILA|nr:unnamed protein product [Bursaphelenchus okinawaensis]CAG9090094.1 unnamed protein product [Bursaphelenchus okinawaensis]
MVNFIPLFKTLLTVGLLGSGFDKVVDNFDEQRIARADEHKYLDRLNPKQFGQFFNLIDVTGLKEEDLVDNAKKLAEEPKIAQSAKLLVVDVLKANNISDEVVEFIEEAGNQSQFLLKTINGEEDDVPEALKPILTKFRKISGSDSKLLEKVLGATVNILNSPEAVQLVEKQSPKPKTESISTTTAKPTTQKQPTKLHDEPVSAGNSYQTISMAVLPLLMAFTLH